MNAEQSIYHKRQWNKGWAACNLILYKCSYFLLELKHLMFMHEQFKSYSVCSQVSLTSYVRQNRSDVRQLKVVRVVITQWKQIQSQLNGVTLEQYKQDVAHGCNTCMLHFLVSLLRLVPF